MSIDLKSIKKEKQFNVPEHYFDQLERKIAARVREEEQRRLLLHRRRMFMTCAVAASLLLCLGVGYFFWNHPAKLDTHNAIAHAKPVPAAAEAPSSPLGIAHATEQPTVTVAQSDAQSQTSSNVPVYMADASQDIFVDELNDIDYQILDNYAYEIALYDWYDW